MINVYEVQKQTESNRKPPFVVGRNSHFMANETLEKLLKRLEQFERSDLYLKNNISLCKLSSYCESNTKYISHVINSCKEQDYNNYINELRIQYIVSKLKTDKNYRKYKIAFLAKEAGFSSPNKFSTIFKNFKGILPSAYIKNLN